MVETVSSGLTVDPSGSTSNFLVDPGYFGTGVTGLNIYSNATNFSDKKNVFKKINDVMGDMGYVAKDGNVTVGQGYRYSSEHAFIAEVRPLFVQYGLIIYPTEIKKSEVIAHDNKNGGKTFLTTITVKYIIGDVDSGEFIEVEVEAQGSDSGDKGVYKALTGAYKYALRQALMIGTGDDPEATDDDGNRTNQAPVKKSAPKGGDYAPTKTVEPKKDKAVPTLDHYRQSVTEAFKGVDVSPADKVFKKRNIDVINPPNDMNVLKALYEMAREVRNGTSIAQAAVNLDNTLG